MAEVNLIVQLVSRQCLVDNQRVVPPEPVLRIIFGLELVELVQLAVATIHGL